MSTTQPRARRKQHRVVKIALAGLALLGVGAAATSAAWTDDALFSVGATSAGVELQARATTTGTWTDADATAVAVVPSDVFANLLPGQTRTATLYLKNSGSTTLAVTSAVVTVGEPLTGTAPNATVSVAPVANLGAGLDTSVVLTVTTPATWDVSHQNKTGGTITVTFTGTAIAP